MESDSQQRRNCEKTELTIKESEFPGEKDSENESLKITSNKREDDVEQEDVKKAQLPIHTEELETKKLKDFQLEDTSDYNVKERNALFQKGLDFENCTDKDNALKCYLGCIKGLTQKTNFVLLPQCLHSIADLYKDKGDYQNAIHFAQAEKMFYETALIDSGEIQEKLETAEKSELSGVTQDSNDNDVESLRAEEYEHLAQLCMDRQQSQLALEYAGKCAKIRQKIYGDNHEKTQSSLNMFAEVYAQVGKLQYTDSVALLEEPVIASDVPPEGALKEGAADASADGTEPISILRQRSSVSRSNSSHELEDFTNLEDSEKKKVSFHKSVDESIKEREKEHKEECFQVAIVFSFLIILMLLIFNFTD